MAASGEVDLEHQLADAYGLDLCQVVTDLHQDELPLEALGARRREVPRRRDRPRAADADRRQPRPHAARLRREPRRDRRRRTSASSSLMGGLTRQRRRQPARDRQPPRRAHRRRGHRHAGAVHGQQRRATATCSLGQKDVAEAFALAKGCDLMLVGIGTTIPEAELVTTGMIEPAEMAAIARAGGVGEMLGHFFDARRPPGRDRAHPAHRHPAARRLREPAHRRHRRRRDQGRRDPRRARERPALTGLITDERTARAIVERPRAVDRTAPATRRA